MTGAKETVAVDAPDYWRRQYIELAQGVEMIRTALEETIGNGILSSQFQTATAIEECELIAKAIYGLRSTPMPDTHKITKAEVVRVKEGLYGIQFEFDSGYADFHEVGDKATAEWYAREKMGETIPIGVNPLLLSAEKAEKLRGISGIR